ncbi:MOP flippase family protein [Methylomonas sp. AM2-LC]|uniref:MOP flippase family protein n=1 Tax=Methylomonas sp. AM2-LC TaxID=3153301 RepID=UPI003267481A
MKPSVSNNAKWIALSQIIRIAVQLISLAVLTRLLNPHQYGLMTMATVVTNFAVLFKDMGTAAAIIQRKELTESVKNTVFTLNVMIGVFIAIVLVLFSPLISAFFKEPELVVMLYILAIIFPVTSSAGVHQALMERNSSFRTLAIIESFSSVTSLVVAITAAYLGQGEYSLVYQALSLAFLSSSLIWFYSKWKPAFSWDKSEFSALFRFSGNLSLFNFINYFSRNADGFIVGRFLGTSVLGAYSMAYKLMLFPVQSLTFVSTRALFPIFSQKQNSPQEVARLYGATISYICYITAPLMAGLFITREQFVLVAFGPNWGVVADILVWLCPVGFIQSIVSTTGTVFMARGRTDILMQLGILGAILQVSAFFIGVQWGVVEVAEAYFFANLINSIPCLIITMRLLNDSILSLLMYILRPLIVSVLMMMAITLCHRHFPFGDYPVYVVLIIEILVGMLAYFIISYLLARQQLKVLLGGVGF